MLSKVINVVSKNKFVATKGLPYFFNWISLTCFRSWRFSTCSRNTWLLQLKDLQYFLIWRSLTCSRSWRLWTCSRNRIGYCSWEIYHIFLTASHLRVVEAEGYHCVLETEGCGNWRFCDVISSRCKGNRNFRNASASLSRTCIWVKLIIPQSMILTTFLSLVQIIHCNANIALSYWLLWSQEHLVTCQLISSTKLNKSQWR